MTKIYKRGNIFPSEVQANFSKADLKKYWLTDYLGFPVGKPFLRKSDIELYQSLKPKEVYEIRSNPVGKPRIHKTDKERKAVYDKKRNQTSERKAYKARLAKEKRKTRNS